MIGMAGRKLVGIASILPAAFLFGCGSSGAYKAPSSGATQTTVRNMKDGRAFQTASLLSTGEVFLAGVCDDRAEGHPLEQRGGGAPHPCFAAKSRMNRASASQPGRGKAL